MTAAARRTVFGIVARYFMSGPVVAWDPLFAASFCPLRLRRPVGGWNLAGAGAGSGRLVR